MDQHKHIQSLVLKVVWFVINNTCTYIRHDIATGKAILNKTILNIENRVDFKTIYY